MAWAASGCFSNVSIGLRKSKERGGRDYVHNIVYHQLGGFCVPDVRTHQARTDGAMRGEAELIRIIPSSDRRRRSQEKVTKTGSNREWQQ